MTFAVCSCVPLVFLKRLLFRVFDGKKFKNFQNPSSSFDIHPQKRCLVARAYIILIREEDDFDQNDDDEFASFWKERCFFCSWSDESEELY